MPEIRVWPVSGSVWTRKVGSSCISLPSAMPSFSWSALVLGSIETAITGSGKLIASSTTGCLGSQIVSPVVTFFRPTAAAMSPAHTSVISSRLLACILSSRPMRSLLPFLALSTEVPDSMWPGVDAEEGELADERVGHDLEHQRRRTARSSSELADHRLRRSSGSMPSIGGMSSGDGR